MAIGNPFLATYSTDNVVRTYELVNGVFVPIGVSAAYANVNGSISTGLGDVLPKLTWVSEDNFYHIAWGTSVSNTSEGTYDRNGVQVQSATGGVTNASNYPVAYLADLDELLYKWRTTTVNLFGNQFAADGTWVSQNLMNAALGILRELQVSNDQMYIIAVPSTGAPKFARRTSALGVRPLVLSAFSDMSMDMTPTMVRWLGGNTVIGINATSIVAYEYAGTGNTFTRVMEAPKPAGTPVIAMPFTDGAHIAISFLNAGAYTTRIYRRFGGGLITIADIANFGKDISISSDGVLIVDAPLKRAVRFDGLNVTNNDAAVANISSISSLGRLSSAPVTKSAMPLSYNALVQALGENSIDVNNLKFTLLDSTAVFSATDATFAAVTNSGAKEVKNGNWPAGGVALANVTRAMSGEEFAYKAPDVKRLITQSTLAWRYGLIYDVTSGKPLIFFDYSGERQIATNRELVIKFPATVFLSLRK